MSEGASEPSDEYHHPPLVTCVYCGDALHWSPAQTEIAEHHADEHPNERYDPTWYDYDGDGPVYGGGSN